MKVPIRSKLILAIGAPLLAVYLIVLALDLRGGRATALRHMEGHLTELASRWAAQFDGEFAAVAQNARSTATFLSTCPDMTEEQIYDLLRASVGANQRIYGACIAFEPGTFEPGYDRFAPYVCRSAEGLRSMDIGREAYDYTAWEWYTTPRELERLVWTEPYYDEGAGNTLMCTVSVPFWREGKVWGVATADISLEGLRDRMRGASIGSGYCTILSGTGRFISHPDTSLVMRETIFSLAERNALTELADLGHRATAGQRGIWRIPDYLTGDPKWVVLAPIPSCGWALAAVVPERNVLAPVYGELRQRTTLLLAGLALTLGIILLTAVHITRPIARLARTVREVAGGNLDARPPPIRSQDEIGEFSRAFNTMVSDLKQHVQALTRETAAREAVESELRVGRRIQASLLPRSFPPYPDRTEFDLHAVNKPAKEVAGDFFDFFFVSDQCLAIVMADVSGKGVPAALFMAVARTVIRNLAMSGLGPKETLEKANRSLAEDNDQGMFVTLFLGYYDTRTGVLRYGNAGHNPPYRVDPDGAVRQFGDPTGMVLGAMDVATYREEEITLSVGEMVVLYTDGVTEAGAPSDDMFGEERLEQLLSQYASNAPKEVCDAVTIAVDEFDRRDTQFDDVTVLALRRTTQSPTGP